jgi:hypothetical protein
MTDEERAGIERRADITRFKLMRTLQALDRKRHEVLDVGHQMKKHIAAVVVVSLSVAFSLGGVVAVLAVRTAERSARRRRERWAAISRAFRHPDRVARAKGALVPSAIGKNVIRALLTTIAAELAKRLMSRVVFAQRKRDVAFDTLGFRAADTPRAPAANPSAPRAVRVR